MWISVTGRHSYARYLYDLYRRAARRVCGVVAFGKVAPAIRGPIEHFFLRAIAGTRMDTEMSAPHNPYYVKSPRVDASIEPGQVPRPRDHCHAGHSIYVYPMPSNPITLVITGLHSLASHKALCKTLYQTCTKDVPIST